MANRKEFKAAMEAFEKLGITELLEIRNYVTFRIQTLKAQRARAMGKIIDAEFVEFEDDGENIRVEVQKNDK